jgi:site-specific recombinase XerD
MMCQGLASSLQEMDGVHGLMARLMYGTGMRISECLALRVKDICLERCGILVRNGKDGGQASQLTYLRHSFATHLMQRGYDRRTVREIVGSLELVVKTGQRHQHCH